MGCDSGHVTFDYVTLPYQDKMESAFSTAAFNLDCQNEVNTFIFKAFAFIS